MEKMRIIRSEDGTKHTADPEKDVRVYNAPVNPPSTGTRHTIGTDLYVRKPKKTRNHNCTNIIGACSKVPNLVKSNI